MRRAAALLVVLLAACSSAPGEVAAPPVAPPSSLSPSPSSGVPVTPAPPSQPGIPVPVAGPAAFTLAATGDILIHGEVREQAARDGSPYDFTPVLAGLRSAIAAADVAVCHLEVPLGSLQGPYSGYPSFSAPPQLATAIRAVGYDTCSTASNHSLDRGVRGVATTLAALDRAGVHHTGTARSASESRPLVLLVRGVRIALLSYTYGFNGNRTPAGQPYWANLIDTDRILKDAAAARIAGAQVTVVSLHWGEEYRSTVTALQEGIATRLTASKDIDLLIGHHAHVVQPVRRINGKYVLFGLGNSLVGPAHNFAGGATREGLAAVVTLTRRDNRYVATAVRLLPTYVAESPLRVVDISTVPAERRLPRLARAYGRVREFALPTPVEGVSYG